MALAFYFSPVPQMSASQYDQCITLLQKAGAGHPPGRLYHAAFGTSDSVLVFDVWKSQEEFDKFGQTLIPILQQLGASPGQPSVMNVHNVIVPPAARPKAPAKKRPAAKKRASAKRAAPKRKAGGRKRKKR
jgi:hypothetical protein